MHLFNEEVHLHAGLFLEITCEEHCTSMTLVGAAG